MSCGTRLVAIPGSELDFAMLLIPKDAAPRLRFVSGQVLNFK